MSDQAGSFWYALPEWLRDVALMEMREAAERNSNVPMGAVWNAAADALAPVPSDVAEIEDTVGE